MACSELASIGEFQLLPMLLLRHWAGLQMQQDDKRNPVLTQEIVASLAPAVKETVAL